MYMKSTLHEFTYSVLADGKYFFLKKKAKWGF